MYSIHCPQAAARAMTINMRTRATVVSTVVTVLDTIVGGTPGDIDADADSAKKAPSAKERRILDTRMVEAGWSRVESRAESDRDAMKRC